jgi:hypothetical protein
MNIACHYVIVRFTPYIETGEFANVGVILFAPGKRYFGFKLLVNRHARVTNFFEELDPRVFRMAMRTFRDEMERVANLLRRMGTDLRMKSLDRESSLRLWAEIIKPRETMLRFSEARVVLAENCETKMHNLYDYYVDRNFATKEYQEKLLERGVRGWLRGAQLLDQFHPGRVGNDEYHAQFPFVSGDDERPDKAIKPLNLAYSDASRIIDRGGQWVVRVNALKKRGLLPQKILFAVNGPDDTSPCGRAKHEVVEDLKASGAIVVPYGSAAPIIEFAAA